MINPSNIKSVIFLLDKANLNNKASMKEAIEIAKQWLEAAIDTTDQYDDENPNYIKGTEDGI